MKVIPGRCFSARRHSIERPPVQVHLAAGAPRDPRTDSPTRQSDTDREQYRGRAVYGSA